MGKRTLAERDNIEGIKAYLLAHRRITPEGCWIWKGTILQSGYGQVIYMGKKWGVHRLSLILFKPIENNHALQANHSKICTHRECFNPNHLY